MWISFWLTSPKTRSSYRRAVAGGAGPRFGPALPLFVGPSPALAALVGAAVVGREVGGVLFRARLLRPAPHLLHQGVEGPGLAPVALNQVGEEHHVRLNPGLAPLLLRVEAVHPRGREVGLAAAAPPPGLDPERGADLVAGALDHFFIHDTTSATAG